MNWYIYEEYNLQALGHIREGKKKIKYEKHLAAAKGITNVKLESSVACTIRRKLRHI